jgi:uncharacterized protein (TIGR02246 family)
MRSSIRSLLLLLLLPLTGSAQTTPAEQISAVNQKFTEAIRHMDNAAVLNLWDEDGVTLLPGMAAVRGKAAIKQFMEEGAAKSAGTRVVSHDSEFHDLQVSGDWASEWAITTQVVQPPDKPQFTIRGKMLLVLHRTPSGEWKIRTEAWTPGA